MYALSGEFQKLIQTRLAMKQLKLTRVTPRTFDSLPESLKKEFPDNPLLKRSARAGRARRWRR